MSGYIKSDVVNVIMSIELAHEKDRCQSLVKNAMRYQVP